MEARHGGTQFPLGRSGVRVPALVQASPGGKMLRAEFRPTVGGASWRAIRRLLTALVLARGVMLMCVLPPLEGWDEYQHVAYVHSMRDRPTAGLRGGCGSAAAP